MSSSQNFLLRYAPDCTFSSQKWKSSLPSEGGHPPPTPSYRYAPLVLSRFAPLQRLRPRNVLAHYATGCPPPPMHWPTVRHCMCVMSRWLTIYNYVSLYQYAVKAHTSLAPLSRFRGSHITTAHEQQCCRFQSYAKTVPSQIKFTSEIDKAWTTFLGSTTTDHVITACDVWL